MHELLRRLLIRFEADVFVIAAVRRQIILIDDLALTCLLAQVVDLFLASFLPRQKILPVRQGSLHHFRLTFTVLLVAYWYLFLLWTVLYLLLRHQLAISNLLLDLVDLAMSLLSI